MYVTFVGVFSRRPLNKHYVREVIPHSPYRNGNTWGMIPHSPYKNGFGFVETTGVLGAHHEPRAMPKEPPEKKKNRRPPWWVGRKSVKKQYFCVVFSNSPCRETPKNVI
jgi:hypothetical protein